MKLSETLEVRSMRIDHMTEDERYAWTRNLLLLVRGENDPTTRENMVSYKPWSLLYWIRKRTRLNKDIGRLFGVFDGENMVAIAGAEINNTVWHNSANLLIRTWVAPEYRHQQIIARYLMPAQMEWLDMIRECNQVGIAWFSFNPSKAPLIKYIATLQRKPELDPYGVWQGWKVADDGKLRLVNNVLQMVVVKYLDWEPCTIERLELPRILHHTIPQLEDTTH